MRILSFVFFTYFSISLVLCADSSIYAHESDEYVGYYHFDKHLPKKGYAIYSSWHSHLMPMMERIGVERDGYILYDNFDPDGYIRRSPSRMSVDNIDKRWRYVSQSPAYCYFENIPFDEFLVYHCAEKNLPADGQKCYFIALRGCPIKFAHEALAHEHCGIYINGEFYKSNDRYPTQHDYPFGWEHSPWPKGEKAPGVIYWREIPSTEEPSLLQQPTEVVLEVDNLGLGDILVRYGNNPEGIPTLHYAIMKGDENAVRVLLNHGASANSKVYQDLGRDIVTLPNTALEYAAKHGHLSIVNLLLDRGAEVQRIVSNLQNDKYVVSSLVFAAESNHSHIIKALVARGAQLNFNGYLPLYELTPFYRAVEENSIEAARVLLDLGVRLDDPVFQYCDLLAMPVINDNIEMAKLLLDHNIVVDSPNSSPSAFGKAIETNKIHFVNLLLSKGAKMHHEKTSSYHHNDPWFLAIRGNNPEIIEILLKAGANIHAVDYQGKEAIFFAANEGRMNALRCLIRVGANINIKSKSDGQPLIVSAIPKSEALQFLIDSGADTNVIFGHGGETLLHIAARSNNPDSIHILMKSGAKINAKTTQGDTPLHTAASQGKEENILALLERGADVNTMNNLGWKPIQLAMNNGKLSLDTLKLCLRLGVNMNEYGPSGHESFLDKAIHSKKFDIANFLIKEAKVNINLKCPSNGKTPFLRAVEYGNLEGMEWLVINGADVNAIDKFGQTALGIAKGSYPQFIEWLVAHGAK